MGLDTGQVINMGGRTTMHGFAGGIDYGQLMRTQLDAKQRPLLKKQEQIDIRMQSMGSIAGIKEQAKKVANAAKAVSGSTGDHPIPSTFHNYNIHIGNPDSRKSDNYYLEIKTDGKPIKKDFNIRVEKVATQSRWQSVRFNSLDDKFSELNNHKAGGIGISTGTTEFDKKVIVFRKSKTDGSPEFVEIEVIPIAKNN